MRRDNRVNNPERKTKVYSENLIVQLETKPILEDEKLTEREMIQDDSYDWFFDSIACSSVNEDMWHGDTIKEIKEYLCSFAPYVEVSNNETQNWIVFKEGFVQAFFERIYPDFKKAIQELSDNSSLDALIGRKHEIYPPLFRLRNMFLGTYGMYVKSEETYLESFIDFIREIKPNVKYYIGGTVLYE